MTDNKQAEDEVGLLMPPFRDEPVAVDNSRRLWLDRFTGLAILLLFWLEV